MLLTTKNHLAASSFMYWLKMEKYSQNTYINKYHFRGNFEKHKKSLHVKSLRFTYKLTSQQVFEILFYTPERYQVVISETRRFFLILLIFYANVTPCSQIVSHFLALRNLFEKFIFIFAWFRNEISSKKFSTQAIFQKNLCTFVTKLRVSRILLHLKL